MIYELIIQKIRGVNGALAITQASGKVKSVRYTQEMVYLEIEDEMFFVADDFIKCQNFSGRNQHAYHVKVSSVNGLEIGILLSEFDVDSRGVVLNAPVEGDELVQFGNQIHKSRQSAIYLHADQNGQPAMDVLFDIDSKDWTNKLKVRVGGEIPNSNGARGFYAVNGLIKSVTDDDQVIYEFSPDGRINLGMGSIKYDPTTKKLTFGNGVILTWESLDEETKENLRGEPVYFLDLTNDNSSVACDSSGNVIGDIPSSQANVYMGSNLSTGWSFSASFLGCSGLIYSDGFISVTKLIDDNSSITIKAAKNGSSPLTAIYTLSKVKAGEDGTPAEIYWIDSSVTVIKKTKSGVVIPDLVSCVKMKQVGAENASITTEKTLK